MSVELAVSEHLPYFVQLRDIPFYSIGDGTNGCDVPIFENLGELVSEPRGFVGPGYRSANRMIPRIFPNGYQYGLHLCSAQELVVATISRFGSDSLVLGPRNFPITESEDPYYWRKWAMNTSNFPSPTFLGSGIVCSDDDIMFGTYSIFGLRCSRTERFGLGVVIDPRAHGGIWTSVEGNDKSPVQSWRHPRRTR